MPFITIRKVYWGRYGGAPVRHRRRYLFGFLPLGIVK